MPSTVVSTLDLDLDNPPGLVVGGCATEADDDYQRDVFWVCASKRVLKVHCTQEAMAKCNAVQSKMPCVFETGVFNTQSSKRANQNFKVTASDRLRPEIVPHDIECASATEKLDGTCCLIQEYQGLPWLWPRLDRKPNRAGDKKFQRLQYKLKDWKASEEDSVPPTITWDPMKDFKEVPSTWIPATGVKVVDGFAQPDKIGHTPGWLPIEKKSRQHCWHLTAVDLDLGLCLMLTPSEDSGQLVIKCRPLSELCGKTCELIGTSINGNPYGLGNKQQPLHVLVVHGSLPVTCPSPLNGEAMHQWFEEEEPESSNNRVEGVVWHCPSGALYKLHRHHLNLPWPIPKPRLSQQPVDIDVDSAVFSINMDKQSQFSLLASVHGCKVDKLCEVHSLLADCR